MRRASAGKSGCIRSSPVAPGGKTGGETRLLVFRAVHREKKPRTRPVNLGLRPVDDRRKTSAIPNRQPRPARTCSTAFTSGGRCPGNDVEFTRTDQRHRDQHVDRRRRCRARSSWLAADCASHRAPLPPSAPCHTEADEGIDREDRAGKQHAEAVEAEGERHRARLPARVPAEPESSAPGNAIKASRSAHNTARRAVMPMRVVTVISQELSFMPATAIPPSTIMRATVAIQPGTEAKLSR